MRWETKYTEIGQSATELWPKTMFKMAAVCHLNVKKIVIFGHLTHRVPDLLLYTEVVVVCCILGARCGQSMIDKIHEKIPIWLSECGATVSYQQDPFAVALVTPLMTRAHSADLAKNICFVDSTASCDADNHILTFMLTVTAAGAVPLGVVITDSTSAASYTSAFSLLKSILTEQSFAGQGHPSVFLTDDCDAERTALQTCWPNADLKLCLFHVPQAVWRWLWADNHKISKDDRKQLMTEFRRIVYCMNETDANIAYDEAVNSETAQEYPNYQEYVQHWWDRRHLWCLAWRNHQHRGHHTNNFAEVTVRLYKDIVLCRAKAYNVVSLVDFTVRVLENYYRNRLRDFSNGRISAQRLLLEKVHRRASYLSSCDQMTDYGDNKYGVPNSDSTELYVVDSSLGCCSCPDGMTGKFCKHQSAVMRLFCAAFPNAPAVTAEARHAVASIALGADCPPVDFYRSFRCGYSADSITGISGIQNQPEISHEYVACMSSENASQQDETVLTQQVSESDASGGMMALLEEYQQLMAMNCSRFASDEACQKAMQKSIVTLKSVNTAAAFASFLHRGEFRRYRAGASIHVQPTALSRRRPGVTRGSKRLASGRPPVGSSWHKVKRRHCLVENISAAVPHAKSH